MKHAFLGRPYKARAMSTRPMSGGLVRFSTVRTASQNICADTAKVLAEGKVFGWFQGRSSSGRARSATAASWPTRARPR